MKQEAYYSALLDFWDGLKTQPGRIGLSLLAIAVGMTALTVLLSVLHGLEDRSRTIVRELGVNVFGVVQEGGRKSDGSGLTVDHREYLSENVPGSIVAGIRTYQAPTLSKAGHIKVVACDADLLRIRQWRLTAGRFIDKDDEQHKARSMVVSRALSEAWGWGVGAVVSLKETPFKVVGVVDVGGSALDGEGADAKLMLGDRVVFVPLTTPPYWLSSGLPIQALDALFVRVPADVDLRKQVARAHRLFTQPDVRAGDLSWVTPDSLLRRVRRLQITIKLTVGSIAVLCLILGGTTLMSLMVANVRDRVPEIGLRRALGATRRDIAFLFVFEACMVTATATLAGTLGTHVLLLAVRNVFPVPLAMGLGTWFTPIVVALGLGIAFSYWPARAAANITPSEALRSD